MKITLCIRLVLLLSLALLPGCSGANPEPAATADPPPAPENAKSGSRPAKSELRKSQDPVAADPKTPVLKPPFSIEQLVNRNPVPTTREDDPPIFDAAYDWDEYRRVYNLLSDLDQHVEAMWPQLVKHLDDDRYCITTERWSGFTYNDSVGEICRDFITAGLSEAYYPDLQSSSFGAYRVLHTPISFDRKVLKKWCEDRGDKNLYELQVEACQWAIERLKDSQGLVDRRFDLSDRTRRAWIAIIEANIELLAESKRATPCHFFALGEDHRSYCDGTKRNPRRRPGKLR